MKPGLGEWERFYEDLRGMSLADFAAEVGDAPFLGLLGKELQEETRAGHRTLSGASRAELASPPWGRFDLVAAVRKSSGNPFAYMVTIGRAENNDIELKDRTISKFHAYFRQVGSGWSLNDANSANGTWVNGVPLTPEAPARLTPGDEISLGPDIKAVFLSTKDVYELAQEDAAH